MLKKLLFTFLLVSGLFISLPVKAAENFMLLDDVTVAGPFSELTPVTFEFSNPVAIKTMEVIIHFTNVVPDRAFEETRYDIIISLESKAPSGLWYTVATDSREFNSSAFYPIRMFSVGNRFILLNNQTYPIGSTRWGVRSTFVGTETTTDYRIVFRVTPEPFIPPRSDDLQSFTVSISGRVWID
jgi:hypothetical protein